MEYVNNCNGLCWKILEIIIIVRMQYYLCNRGLVSSLASSSCTCINSNILVLMDVVFVLFLWYALLDKVDEYILKVTEGLDATRWSYTVVQD